MIDNSKRMRFTFVVTCLLITLSSVCWGQRVAAQPLGRTTVSTFSISGAPIALDWAAELEAELIGRRVPVISMHDARDRFTTRSRAPQNPTSSDLDALAKEARKAVEHVAFGRSAAAEQSVRDIVVLAERSLESLNRETQNARRLLDACLALVRSSLHDGHRAQAIEQAMGCRRLVPDLAPNQSSQPANVIGVLAEADDELRRMRIGSLKVEHVPPRACSVYLNGRHLGMTPFALDQAAVGAYRVQVECEQNAGRVHVVHLGDQPVELRVDSELDRAVITEPRLGFRYGQAEDVRRFLLRHAVALGGDIQADDLVLIHRPAADVLEVVRVNVKHRQIVAAFRGPAGVPSLSSALDTVTQGRFVGVTPDFYTPASSMRLSVRDSAAPGLGTPHTAPDPVESPKPIHKKWWLWTTVGLVVAGGVAAGLVLGLRGDRRMPDEPVITISGR